MHRTPAALMVLGLTVTGCGFSTVDPDSSVSISGRALDAAGKPLANGRVLLMKQADLGEVVFGTILTVGTLSAICFAPEAPTICDKARTTTTDEDGRYRFEVKGSDTQGSLGTEATMNVVLAGAAGRSSTTVSFVARDDSVTVPDARLWNLRADVRRRGDRIEVTWRPLPRAAGGDPAYSAQLYDARSGKALWTQSVAGGRAELDPRLLEDRKGTVAVGAGTELPGGEGIGEARALYSSAQLPVAASAGAPPSRGRPCAPVTGTGPDVGRFRTPCGATDGNLGEPAKLAARGNAPVTGVVVDLGRARPVDLVVARGFSGQFLVETSTDAKAWDVRATGSGLAYAAKIPGRPTARYVRLRSPAGLDESLSSEVSVW